MKLINFFLLALLYPSLQLSSDFQLFAAFTICVIDSLFKLRQSFKYVFMPLKGKPIVSMERYLV
jgi:hypothetical protein